jgi:hypothetical protein
VVTAQTLLERFEFALGLRSLFGDGVWRVDGMQALPQAPLKFVGKQEEIRVGRLPDPAARVQENGLNQGVQCGTRRAADPKRGRIVDSVADRHAE